MSGKALSYLFLFVASLGIGIGIGEWFYSLFLKAMPPSGLSQVTTGATHMWHWAYGAAVGVAMFLWALIAIGMNKLTSIGKKSEPRS